MGENYKASHLKKTTVQNHEFSLITHERFCGNRGFAALGNGVAGFSFLVSCRQETRAEHLKLETRNMVLDY
jgi:hypothetical protein